MQYLLAVTSAKKIHAARVTALFKAEKAKFHIVIPSKVSGAIFDKNAML